MGNISMKNTKKEENDKSSLIKPEIDNSTIEEDEDSHGDPSQNSPTPRNPLPKSKSRLCRKLFFLCFGLFVFLVLFISFVFFVDYQQGYLGDHNNQRLLPVKVREFPANVRKSVADMLYETPKEIQLVFDGIVKSVNGLINSTDSKPTVEAYDEIGDKTYVKIDVPRKKDKEANDEMEDKTYVMIDVPREKDKDISEEIENDEVDDNDGMFGIVGFFLNIFEDIASVFNVNNKEADENVDVNSMINSTEIPKSTYYRLFDDPQSDNFESTEEPYIFNQRTQNKVLWDIKIEVIDEVSDDSLEKNHEEEMSNNDKFRILLPNKNPNHLHEN